MATEAAVLEALGQVKSEIDTTLKKLTEQVEKQDEQIRTFGGTSTEVSNAIKSLEEGLRKRGEDLIDLQKSLGEIEAKLKRPDLGVDNALKSIGQRFVESDEYKAFHKAQGSKRMQDEFKVGRFFKSAVTALLERKEITGASSLREILATERILEIIASPLRTQRIRDLFQVIPTENSSIDFVRETGFTNLAATVQENTGNSGTDVAKPKSTITFGSESISVKTIAHWTPAPKQLIRDIPALQAYIDSRLLLGLGIVEDEELLFGDGTGTHIEGIFNVANIQTYNWSAGTYGDTKIDAIRRGMNKVRVAEYAATGIVLSPNDWTDIELLKDNQGRYIWTVVTEGGQKRLWAVPVVDTTAMVDGQFLTGAFLGGANIWDREEAAVTIGDQHADFMVKNLLAILAEERIALTVYRPEAFVAGTFDDAPAIGS